MVNFCSVYGCSNRSNRDKVSFYRFPYAPDRLKEKVKEASSDRRRQWVNAIKRKDLTEDNLKYARVCSMHFHSGKPAHLNDKTNPDWIPSLNMGLKEGSQSVRSRTKSINRYQRLKVRQENINDTDPPDEVSNPEEDTYGAADDNDDSNMAEPSHSDKHTQTDTTGAMMSATDFELRRCHEKIYKMEETIINLTISEKTMENDDKKTLFFTSLPTFLLLKTVFEVCSPSISISHTSVLSKWQQFLVFLIKIRLNLKFQDLAYRFNVSASSISRAFHNCLDIFIHYFGHVVRWPDRDELMATMPKAFVKSFGKKVAIIIDCFEVAIETPSNLMAKCQTWSSYKHKNTVKFLIGISPQGTITYISEAWGGRVSDKLVTEQCGILKHLLPGDIILADQGFNINDLVAFHYAEVKLPAFTKGKKQLSPHDVEETRKIAHLRIHVERVIGTTRRKYTILNGPITREMLDDKGVGPTIDKVVLAACALTSLCPSVVPLNLDA